MNGLSPIYYVVFTGVTAAAVVLQALVLIGIYVAVRRSTGKMLEALDEVKSKGLPTLESAKSLLDDVSPKLKTATSNLAEVSESLRSQASHVNATVESLLEKTNSQVDRVDGMVTASLDAVERASKVIDMAIALPTRRVTGILHGLKAGMDVLMRSRKPSGRSPGVVVEVSAEKPEQSEDAPVPVERSAAQQA